MIHAQIFLGILIAAATVSPGVSFSAEENTERKSSTQNIGGLLFDVDEGVKVEQGPGGSVYVKSNREYMQEKFRQIEDRLNDFEERLKQLEQGEQAVPDEPGAVSRDGRRVLIT